MDRSVAPPLLAFPPPTPPLTSAQTTAADEPFWFFRGSLRGGEAEERWSSAIYLHHYPPLPRPARVATVPTGLGEDDHFDDVCIPTAFKLIAPTSSSYRDTYRARCEALRANLLLGDHFDYVCISAMFKLFAPIFSSHGMVSLIMPLCQPDLGRRF